MPSQAEVSGMEMMEMDLWSLRYAAWLQCGDLHWTFLLHSILQIKLWAPRRRSAFTLASDCVARRDIDI